MFKHLIKTTALLLFLPCTANCAGVLSLSFSTNVISEAQTVGATVATIRTDSILTSALPIGIFSDAIQITTPASVTIPMGTNAVTFSVGAVNNGNVDGTRVTTITVAADTWTAATNTLTITDDDTPTNRTIGGNLVGTLTNYIYWVTTPLTIARGQTLTIDAGNTLLFAAGAGVNNGGTLLAAGSAGAKIQFTSAAANPTNGSWNGLTFTNYNTPPSLLSQVEIAYARTGVAVTPAGDSTSLLLLTNSAIHNCSGNGIAVTANSTISISSTAVQIVANQIYNNGNHGVFIRSIVDYCDAGTANTTSVVSNNIFGNAAAGIRLQADTTGYGCGVSRRGSVNALVANNTIHGNLYGIWGLASQGPYATMGRVSATIQNNLIKNNSLDGVRLGADQGSYSGNFAELAPRIANNTIVANAGSGISSATNFIAGFSVLNNLLVENNYGVNLDAVVTTTNFVVGFNDVWANGLGNWVYCPGFGTAVTNNANGIPADASMNIAADPLLGGIDGYHLTAGSPAVDAGATNAAPATDAEGHARLGPPDLGCYELPGPLLTPAARPGGGSLGVVVTGGRGLTYTMQATRDFSSWFTVTNLTMTNGIMQSSLPILPGEQHLFYRAK